tara:strand:+ start:259 stop:441 length:183 start_codon:yes stop_codon:yes gene_type:complete
MIIHKNHRYRKLTPTQLHDVWEVADVDEITQEVEKTMKTLGMSTEEVKKALPTKEKNNES